MAFTVDVDFPWNQGLREVLLMVRKHKGKIIDFDPTGPGGGNPNLLLSFADEQQAMGFLIEHSPPGEDQDFLRSRLEAV